MIHNDLSPHCLLSTQPGRGRWFLYRAIPRTGVSTTLGTGPKLIPDDRFFGSRGTASNCEPAADPAGLRLWLRNIIRHDPRGILRHTNRNAYADQMSWDSTPSPGFVLVDAAPQEGVIAGNWNVLLTVCYYRQS
jgi:hypothetical protein